MPGKRAARSTREHYPAIAARINEDPARYLDVPLVEPDHPGVSPFLLAKARIQGIDFLEIIEAWIDVEIALARGPRRQVIALLNQRKHDLESLGDRDDRLAEAPRRLPEPTESNAVWVDQEDGEQATAARVGGDSR